MKVTFLQNSRFKFTRNHHCIQHNSSYLCQMKMEHEDNLTQHDFSAFLLCTSPATLFFSGTIPVFTVQVPQSLFSATIQRENCTTQRKVILTLPESQRNSSNSLYHNCFPQILFCSKYNRWGGKKDVETTQDLQLAERYSSIFKAVGVIPQFYIKKN